MNALPEDFLKDPAAYYRNIKKRIASRPAPPPKAAPAPVLVVVKAPEPERVEAAPAPSEAPLTPLQQFQQEKQQEFDFLAELTRRRIDNVIEDWCDLRMSEIMEYVALKHRMTIQDLVGPFRNARMIRARFEAMWCIRQTGRYSLPEIGRAFNRDHTTVLNAIRKVDSELSAGKLPKPELNWALAMECRKRYMHRMGIL